jgi:ethanolamine ammonia-lyase small subunit
VIRARHEPDPWSRLRRHTSARIALGRAGASLPTAEVLQFALAHAAARDAVHSELEVDRLERGLQPLNLPILRLQSRAADRQTYLQRPDLGRALDDASLLRLSNAPRPSDVALIVADGLSAVAAQEQAPMVLERMVPKLRDARLTIAPLCLVRFGRVAIQDEIGAALGTKAAVILIGERPGLGSADSLGAYLVFDPKPGRTDADRNCVSNIRPEGLHPHVAAETVAWLLLESLRRRISGVELKDERTPLMLAGSQAGELADSSAS